MLELPGGEPFAEVGVDPAAIANEVAWVGAPPRLLVLSRYPEHTRLHLVDPHGPRALADLRIETPMRLAATCGAHALVVSPQSALVVTAADNILVSVPYPARAVPAHAGVAGTNFLVAHADSVEEWDPQARMPKRRLKLPRAVTITTLGGSDRVVWMTTQQEPARLDVLALVDRGQPKAHDLPEPIVLATGHPRSDLVVCVGESGKVYVVDLDGRSKLKTLTIEGIDTVHAAGLVVGRIIGVLAAQAERPVAILTLEGHTPEPEAPRTTPGRAAPTTSAPPASGPTRTPSSTNAPGSGPTSSTNAPGSGPTSSTNAPGSGATRTASSTNAPPATGPTRTASSTNAPPATGPTRTPSATTPPASAGSAAPAGASSSETPPATAPSSTSTSVVAPLPTGQTEAPVERKKPPPPPPGRSGNTVPPPIAGAAHASVPLAPSAPHRAVASTSSTTPTDGSTDAAGSTSTGSAGAGSTSAATSATMSATGSTRAGASRSLSPSSSSTPAAPTPPMPPAAPGASSLARPATRAFARAPTPHPRAPSEGVDVDLDGVFDDLSAEAHAYNGRASSESSEQFDSPLAFEARPMADHAEPSVEKKSAPKLTDPRPVPNASDRSGAAKTDDAARDERSSRANDSTKPNGSTTTKDSASTTSGPTRTSAGASATTSDPAVGISVEGAAAKATPNATSKAAAQVDTTSAQVDAPSKTVAQVDAMAAASIDDDANAAGRSLIRAGIVDDAEDEDDDEDLAPPMSEPSRRDGSPRDGSPVSARDAAPLSAPNPAPVRDSGPMRAPTRESSLSLRDTPRKPARREVTIRQAPPLPVPKPAWRDEIVFWTYEVFDGVVQRGAPIASPLDDLAKRFDVPDTILPALVVLYGAHLAGERGVAPVHVARVLGSWDEALGRGLLAGRGLATFVESRVRLAGPIQRFLDEVAVETGALVGIPGHIALPGPHSVIAKAETPLKVVAVRWLAQVGGAILAAHEDADLSELFVEARARGAAPMFRIGADELLELGTDPAILVVTDEEVAESLGVPRLG